MTNYDLQDVKREQDTLCGWSGTREQLAHPGDRSCAMLSERMGTVVRVAAVPTAVGSIVNLNSEIQFKFEQYKLRSFDEVTPAWDSQVSSWTWLHPRSALMVV